MQVPFRGPGAVVGLAFALATAPAAPATPPAETDSFVDANGEKAYVSPLAADAVPKVY